MNETLTVALLSEVFFEADAEARLRERLVESKERGAELAVLPEIGCNPWSPATKARRDDDAEPIGGRRHQMQQRLAREVGIGLVGASIVTNEAGSRRNRALVFDAHGEQLGWYEKLHVPDEPGFWERDHYDPGTTFPQRIDGFSMPIGVQICSDMNRPEGCHLLGAQGVEAILAPRSTELATWRRWRPVLIANAVTSCAYVLTVNRPAPEQGVLIGGPTFVVGPDGEVLIETTESLAVVTLERAAIERARPAYPGYLPVRADLYAEGWAKAAEQMRGARARGVAANGRVEA
ncbi:MAG: carbon-nitrogen hydrolase family protein [Phycisphaerales bacterium]